MPLQDFFKQQQLQLRAFLDGKDSSICLLQHADDIRKILDKALLALDEDDSHSHLLVYVDQPWSNADSLTSHLLQRLQQQADNFRDEFKKLGIRLPEKLDSGTGTSLQRLKHAADGLIESIPGEPCSLAFIIPWDGLEDAAAAEQYLADLLRARISPRIKWIVLDELRKSRFPELAKPVPKVHVQRFHLEMGEVEKQVVADLKGGKLTPEERIRYLSMAGAFAAAHRRFDEAEVYQQEVLKLAPQHGKPADQAVAYYNLGNSLLNRKQLEQAEQAFGQAANICMAEKSHNLLAMVLVNLGITLHQQQRVDEALESLEVARRTFAASGNRPGEAHVFDCKASILGIEKRSEEAEQAWRQALSCYDSISNPSMADVRKHGRDDIVVKLTQYMKSIGKPEKVADLESKAEVSA